MHVVAISGSTRRDSLNTRLAHLVEQVRRDDRVTVVSDLNRLPFYDGDVEAAGTPEGVAELRAIVNSADLLVLVTPEYNGSVPGVLTNAIDWLSRPHGQSAVRETPTLVLSASPSPSGGARAAEQLRAVLRRLGADVAPFGLAVARAHQRLGETPDPAVVTQLRNQLSAVADRAVVNQPDDEVPSALSA